MKSTIFETKDQYIAFLNAWKESCKDKSFHFSAEHFALYAIIRGKDPKKCFASPEQQSKKKMTCQGRNGYEAYNRSMNLIYKGGAYSDARLLSPFQGTLTALDLIKIREEGKKEAA